jgi:hypothetical protein
MSIRSILNRTSLLPRAYSEQFDGTGTAQLVLPNYPVLGLPTLSVSGQSISQAAQEGDGPGFCFGFRYQPWNGIPPGNPAVLELVGTRYWGGRQNVVVNYSAGYQITDEPGTVDATTYQITPLIPQGNWASDQGVVYADTGVALVPVADSPTVGQYVPPNPEGLMPILYYQFSVDDASQNLLLSYGFIPYDIEQVALEVIADRASYRTRAGVRSKSLAGQETIAYTDTALNDYVNRSLGAYISVLPPAIGAAV